MEKKGGAGKGLRTTIKENITITNLTKNTMDPSSTLGRMGGVIIIISEVQWLCHLCQYVHEVQHPHLHFLVPAMEQQKLHFFGPLSSNSSFQIRLNLINNFFIQHLFFKVVESATPNDDFILPCKA
jgi:hypothetical protein